MKTTRAQYLIPLSPVGMLAIAGSGQAQKRPAASREANAQRRVINRLCP